ncbi:MAG: type I 3-dehydroquinate dehydratase [Dehalococcoidaceae bacterium]|nr:type I 3-dehydroquinate dehydratase [Dehalococcoidaceae bacterium]
MNKPRICTVITTADSGILREVAGISDLYELRLDLIGKDWQRLLLLIDKPWIATCRSAREGGKWNGSEQERSHELIKACRAGACMADIELTSPILEKLVHEIKKTARLVLSYHNFELTPPIEELVLLAKQGFVHGADIVKIATTARCLEDNLTVLKLARVFKNREIVSMAMGEAGICSRILGPLSGNTFTYAAAACGFESASGQLTTSQLRKIYSLFELL